jgi:translation elongation factor EF-G
LNIINEQLSSFYFKHFNKKKFIEDIDRTTYEFDNVTINKLKKLSKAEIIAEINAIVGNFAIYDKSIDTSKITINNIYLPCGIENNSYCNKKKLVVNQNMNEMIEILATDILDPIKEKYLVSGLFSDNIINYFNFEFHSFEQITISRL